MTGLSRFILVGGLPDTINHHEFHNICTEFGPVKSFRLQKQDNGSYTGHCEYEHCDSATVAVKTLNTRCVVEGQFLRASFPKSVRTNMPKSCNLRVKYLPLNINQEEVSYIFSRFGAINRCKILNYEKNSTAHLTYDTIQAAENARRSMNNKHWMDDVESPKIVVEFNSAYIPVHANLMRKSDLIGPGGVLDDVTQSFIDADQAAAAASLLYQGPQTLTPTQYYLQATPAAYATSTGMPQPYESAEYTGASGATVSNNKSVGPPPPAQYVQVNPYYWPGYSSQGQSATLYDQAAAVAAVAAQSNSGQAQQATGPQPTSNGVQTGASSTYSGQLQQSKGAVDTAGAGQAQTGNATSQQQQNTWNQMYSQIVQHMQNTQLYSSSAATGYTHPGAAGQNSVNIPTAAYSTSNNFGAGGALANGNGAGAAAQPLLSSLYCASALSPTPQNYSLFLNPGFNQQQAAVANAATTYYQPPRPYHHQYQHAQQQHQQQPHHHQHVASGPMRLGGGRHQSRNAIGGSGYVSMQSHQSGGGAGQNHYMMSNFANGGRFGGSGHNNQRISSTGLSGGGAGLGSSHSNSNYHTLYVYNTGNSMTEDIVRSLFARFGPIVDVSVPKDLSTGASRNFAFVTFVDLVTAQVAIEQMNGYQFSNRVLQVSFKKSRNSTLSSNTGVAAKNSGEERRKNQQSSNNNSNEEAETKSVAAEEDQPEIEPGAGQSVEEAPLVNGQAEEASIDNDLEKSAAEEQNDKNNNGICGGGGGDANTKVVSEPASNADESVVAEKQTAIGKKGNDA